MTRATAKLTILFILGLIVLWVYLSHTPEKLCPPKEKFKVLGSLSNQKDLYYNCISDCERSDPTKHMTPTKGSMMCQEYCESTITDIVRRGGPSYPRDIPVVEDKLISRIDESYKICGEGTFGAKCRSDYTTKGEIDEKCRQNCEYSPLPKSDCMNSCSNNLSSNQSIGWSWK